jgi:CHAT domain-containing protein
MGKQAEKAGSLACLGHAYYALGEYKKAVSNLEGSLAILSIYDSSRDNISSDFMILKHKLKPKVVLNLGNAYYSLGKYKDAIVYFKQSELFYRLIGANDQRVEKGREFAFIPVSVARTFTNQFDLRKEADRVFNEVLTAYSSKPVEMVRPPSLKELTHWRLIEKNLKKSLSNYQALGDKSKEEYILILLGNVCMYMMGGEVNNTPGHGLKNNDQSTHECINFHQQSLKTRQSQDQPPHLEERLSESASLITLGRLYANANDKDKSISYLQKGLLILDQLAMSKKLSEITKSEYIQFMKVISLQALCHVYAKFSEREKALDCYNYLLSYSATGATIPTRIASRIEIGDMYFKEGKYYQAISWFESALQDSTNAYGDGFTNNREVVLSRIGISYKMLNRPTEAISYLEKSAKLILESRRSVPRKYRDRHWVGSLYVIETFPHLIDILIQQNLPEKAFEWSNLGTKSELIDYNRLINSKTSDASAQKAVDNWNVINTSLVRMRLQLEANYSEKLAKETRLLEEKVYTEAETIGQKYPTVAELFETNLTDIAKLRQHIASDMLVVQPVVLPNKIALFLITNEKLMVIQSPAERDKLNTLIIDYRAQLEDYKNSNYAVTSSKLYEVLIRPIEEHIEHISKKRLAFITSGQLRYIPFETLYDDRRNQVLLEKFPISYLTRISTSALPKPKRNKIQVLAFANPKPTRVDLLGTEIEANNLVKTFPGSKVYLGANASLEKFKEQAFQFPYIHLGTHGCFLSAGCPNLDMKANTLLFANNQQYNIADAALLGLQNTELITLSACQTAKESFLDEIEIPGLAYVFERAGAQSVLASIWNAEDNTSADIIIKFYYNLKNGLAKNEALRQAKLSHLKKHPFFWAPFILIGDSN